MKKILESVIRKIRGTGARGPLKDTFDPKTFCPLPFTHLEMNPDGRFRPCCKSNFNKEDYIEASSDEDVWNTSVLKRMRWQLFNGEEAQECRNCFDVEKTGATSLRLKNLRNDGEHMKRFRKHSNFDQETMHSYSKPSHIKLSLSNKCNLQCRMCNPLYSSRWEKGILQKKEFREYVNDSSFLQEAEYGLSSSQTELEEVMLNFLNINASEIERLDFLGGEPFLQSNHIKALEMCKNEGDHIRLEYSSNLTTFGNRFKEITQLWEHYKSVEITVSLDGPPQISEYIRHGSKTETIVDNIVKLRNWAQREKVELKLLGGCAFSVHNTPFFEETVQFITSLGLDFVINFVTSPEFQSPQVLSRDVKKQITHNFHVFKEAPEKSLEDSFNSHPLWQDSELRRMQIESIVSQLESLIVFMNAEDQSHLAEENEKFDKLFDRHFGVAEKDNKVDFT